MDANKKLISGVKILIPAYILGILFDIFIRNTWGISFPIFYFLTVSSLFYLLNKKKKIKLNTKLLIFLPIFVLSLTFFTSSNLLFQKINFLLVPLLIIASFLGLKHKSNFISWNNLVDIFSTISLSILSLTTPYSDFLKSIKQSVKQRSNSLKHLLKILKSLLITTPLLLLIIALLGSADVIFQESVDTFFSQINIFKNFSKSFSHLITIVIFSSLIASLFNSIINVDEQDNYNAEQIKKTWDPFTSSFSLTLINIVYLFFIIIQFRYLFGGEANILDKNFTYAQYARRGFFEITTVCLINFVIILTVNYFIRRKNKKINPYLKLQKVLMNIANFILLYSAFTRLALYIETFGFTRARIISQSIIIGLLIINAHLFYKITIKEKSNFVNFAFVTGISIYCLLNLVNLDSYIVEKNVERYNKVEKIDIYYLNELSFDATPEITKLYQELEDNSFEKQNLKEILERKAKKLVNYDNSIFSYNLSIEKAKNLLEAEIEIIEKEDLEKFKIEYVEEEISFKF